jgi:ABC-type spermidine/putrescine transport system permease subunit II
MDAARIRVPARGRRRCGRGSAGAIRVRDLRPLANLLLWAFAGEVVLPEQAAVEYGFSFWVRVFNPRGDALASLGTSVWIAVLTVIVSLAVAIPAGYALARLKLPFRALILLLFLLPQAVPNMPIYVNIARVFYEIGLNGTVIGVVLVHAAHGLVLAVWIASASFAAVDASLDEAARNLGASPWTCFRTITLPLAAPGLMASAIFVFLESLDEFTGTFFVGVPTSRRCRSSCSMQARAATTRSLDHGAPAAAAVDRLHAGGRAFPQGRRAGDGRAVARRRDSRLHGRSRRSTLVSRVAAIDLESMRMRVPTRVCLCLR